MGAYALALLLVRSDAPVLRDSVVSEVHFQTRRLGWRTDDLLIVAEPRPGVTRKLAIQSKRSFKISEKDEECVRTICAAWDDFVSAERFDPSQDWLAIVTLQGTTTLLTHFRSLLDAARAAHSAEDFRSRLGPSGYLSQTAKAQNGALTSILHAHLGGLDEERYWQFLRRLTVLSLDLGTPTSQKDAEVLSLLAYVASEEGDPRETARATWTKLLDLASEASQAGASYRRDDLPKELRDRHSPVPTASERARSDLIAHGATVRNNIRTTIAHDYTIDRAGLSNEALTALLDHRIVLVSGTAGSGKSAVAKLLLDRIEPERPVLAFQAVEFATAHINDTLSKTQTTLNASTLLALLVAHDRTTILIDGLERLLEHSVRDAFIHLLEMVGRTSSLQLLVTCRDYSLDVARSAFLEPLHLSHRVVEVGQLSDVEIDAVAAQVTMLAPPLSDVRMRSLLRTPYLLDMASRLEWTGTSMPENVRAFRERCWRDLIRNESHSAEGMPGRRERTFVAIARRRAEQLRPYVSGDDQDSRAVDVLLQASLLERSPESKNLYAPSHDVLEDWAILQWLDDVASGSDDAPAALAAAVDGYPAIRRGLRRWIGERLEVDPVNARELVMEVSARVELAQHFRDDCIVAALRSPAAVAFVDGCRQRIDLGDITLLRQVVHLLRVACKTVPEWLPVGSVSSILLIPTGPAWPAVLDLMAMHMPAKPDEDAMLALSLAEDWARQLRIGASVPSGAESAGAIASASVGLFHRFGRDETLKRALKLVLMVPRHAPNFDDLTRRALIKDRSDHLADEFADLAMSTLSSAFVSQEYPDFVTALLRSRLMLTDEDLQRYGHRLSPMRVDEFFGMHEHGVSDFFPASALQGPFRALFRHHPRKALDFVLELSNHAATWYGERKWPGNDLEEAEPITIEVPGHGPAQQWFLGRLYGLYRGMTVGPYALQSALMALEEWLLAIAKFESVNLEGWLLDILARGNSALTTAVVASVCVANPERSGLAAFVLLSSRALFGYDRARMAAEGMHSLEFLAGLNPNHEIYESERREANKLSHRREDLESLALKLQLTDKREKVWALIDKYRDELTSIENPQEAQLWRLALHRMDLRGFKVVDKPPGLGESETGQLAPAKTAVITDKRESMVASEGPAGTNQASAGDRTTEHRVYLMPGGLEPDLQELVKGSQQRMGQINRHIALNSAARKAWENRRGPEAADWRSLLAEARAIAEQDDDVDVFVRGGPGIVAAVCIRDQLDTLNAEDRAWCIARVTHELSKHINDQDDLLVQSRMFAPDRVAAAVVPLLVARVPNELPIDPIEVLLLALTHPADEVVEYAYGGVGAFLTSLESDLAFRCAAAAVRQAVVLEEIAAAKRPRTLLEPVVEIDPSPMVSEAVRQAVSGGVEDAKAVLTQLPFDTWPGRAAAIRIWPIVVARSESVEMQALVARAASWLAGTWGEERRNRGGDQRDFQAEHSLSRLICRFALKLPDEEAKSLCAPLIALIATEPREAATFVGDLIVEADGGSGDSFWALWQAMADGAVSSNWVTSLDRERPYEEPLINRLFLRVSWKDGTTHWARLDDNAYRINAFATRLPAVPVVAEAYLHFLYDVGRQELPDAFKVVQAMLERSEDVRVIFSSEAAFVLESLLGAFVYGQPYRVKRDVSLRTAVLKLLDHLVSVGSSAAYRMRDDFVTPLRGASSA